jgi:hypothetical protein
MPSSHIDGRVKRPCSRNFRLTKIGTGMIFRRSPSDVLWQSPKVSSGCGLTHAIFTRKAVGQWTDSTWKAIEIHLYKVLTHFPCHFHPPSDGQDWRVISWSFALFKLARCSHEIGGNRLSCQCVTAPLVVLLSIQFHVLWNIMTFEQLAGAELGIYL